MFKFNRVITIKFTYNSVVHSLKINKDLNMQKKTEEFYTEDTALDGTKYKNYITTTTKDSWSILYKNCYPDVYYFFQAVDVAEKAGYDILFSMEQDDGTFDDMYVLINNFRYYDRTVTEYDRQKIYKDLSLEIVEI